MTVEVLPRALLESFIAMLQHDSEAMARWHDEADAAPLRRVAAALQSLLEDPANVWASVADCARLLDKSEETIRRWCRNGTAPFRFHKREDGQYEIWLPDLLKTKGDNW